MTRRPARPPRSTRPRRRRREGAGQTGWKLTDILVTHHHADHTDGIKALKDKYQCRVVAPAAEAGKIPGVDETVREGGKVKVGKSPANVIETPGHTLGHIAYWFHADNLAFVGDTLFSIGCGRVIEGNMEQMWDSLKKLRDLPDDTADLLRPRIHRRQYQIRTLCRPRQSGAGGARRASQQQLLAEGAPTIPVTIGDEKLANPFLRADVADLACDIGMAGKPANEVFAEIRERKNKF